MFLRNLLDNHQKLWWKKLESPHNQANGVGSCRKNHGSPVPAALKTGVTPWKAEEGPSLLTAAKIDAAVDWSVSRPDRIPNSKRTLLHWANRGILDAVFNSALKIWVFPTQWKVAQLVIPQKPGRLVGDPNLFWSLCMLDTIRKFFRIEHCRAAEEALLGKAHYVYWPVCKLVAIWSTWLGSSKSSLHRQLRSASSTQLSA